MIKLDKPIIVEGKYDKITLQNIVDTLIIQTDGFRIFKDAEKRALIKFFAEREGIIIMTDSDNAGNMIRSHIKNIAANGKIINVYIPRIEGKEKRKERCGKEGILGVEGMSPQIILDALEKSGVTGRKTEKDRKQITKTDLFLWGLSGCQDSSQKREQLLKHLSLPINLSTNAMLDVLNTIYSSDEFSEVICDWQKEKIKN